MIHVVATIAVHPGRRGDFLAASTRLQFLTEPA